MLQAIKRNKAGRNFQDATDWRSLFGASEDSLTSCVFGHLFYLPAALVWALLREAAYQFQLPESVESPIITSYAFWPHWPAALTRNSNYVEPDVFVRTTSFDLILEAKRFDYDQQDCAQWQDQLQAYSNEFGDETPSGEARRPVLLLAIGGIRVDDELPTQIRCGGTTAMVYRCRWINLLNSIQALRTRLDPGQEHLEHILADIVHSFGLHGYTTRPLLNTLPPPLQPLQQGAGLPLFLRLTASSPALATTG